MKLGELLTEAPLASYGRNYAGPRLGPNNIGFPNGDTVKQLKAALARHQLYIPGQPENPSQKAWIGDNTGEWTQALSDAVIAWKRSINAQDGSARLDDRTPELSPRAIDYLLFKELYTQSTNAGLLKRTGSGTAAGTAKTAPWTGQTVDLATVIDTPTESIKNVQDFLAAITFSGWSAILEELIAKKEYSSQSRAAEMQRMLKEIYVKQNHTPYIWLQSWEDNVLREDGEDLKATLVNGTEIPFHPVRSGSFNGQWGSMAVGAQRLYDYFKVMGNGLLRKAQEAFVAAQQVDREKEENPVVNSPSLTNQQISVWVVDMNEAITKRWYGNIPGIDGIESSSVRDLMAQLKTSGDWDKVSAEYNDTYKPKILSKQLVDNLSEDDYNSYVVRNLSRIRRINLEPFFYSIKFGNTEESVTVEYEGKEYTVMKAKQNGRIVVKQGNEEVKDVLVIDGVLRAAITKTEGVIPDFNVALTEENIASAKQLTLITVEQTAPYMVPYYTAQEPFDKMVAPGMGMARLTGLATEAARMLTNGIGQENVVDWLANQVLADAEWLIGLDEVHFDKRWQETSNAQKIKDFGGILDVQDATDEEKDLAERIHRAETREEAFAEILNSNDPESFYERMYRIFKEEHGQTIDERVFNGKTDELAALIMKGTPISDAGFSAVITQIGPAKAAPLTMAKLYEDSMKGEWWEIFGGTNEELVKKLTKVISDREDYQLVNEYYKQYVAGAQDLIDDLDDEYLWDYDDINQNLRAAIGEPASTISKADLDPGLQRILGNLSEETTTQNLEKVRDELQKRDNNYFTVYKDDKPTMMLDQEKIATVFVFLTNLVEESGNVFTDEQKELFIEILDAMHIEIQRIMDISEGTNAASANRMPYNMWKQGYEKAKSTNGWFTE